MFIIEWGKTKIDVAEHALSTTRGVYDNLLGVVLNKVDLKALNRYEATFPTIQEVLTLIDGVWGVLEYHIVAIVGERPVLPFVLGASAPNSADWAQESTTTKFVDRS